MPCIFHPKGTCKYGAKCPFSHEKAKAKAKREKSRSASEPRKPKGEGKEPKDMTMEAKKAALAKRKAALKVCASYLNTGNCKFGKACIYAHYTKTELDKKYQEMQDYYMKATPALKAPPKAT